MENRTACLLKPLPEFHSRERRPCWPPRPLRETASAFLAGTGSSSQAFPLSDSPVPMKYRGWAQNHHACPPGWEGVRREDVEVTSRRQLMRPTTERTGLRGGPRAERACVRVGRRRPEPGASGGPSLGAGQDWNILPIEKRPVDQNFFWLCKPGLHLGCVRQGTWSILAKGDGSERQQHLPPRLQGTGRRKEGWEGQRGSSWAAAPAVHTGSSPFGGLSLRAGSQQAVFWTLLQQATAYYWTGCPGLSKPSKNPAPSPAQGSRGIRWSSLGKAADPSKAPTAFLPASAQEERALRGRCRSWDAACPATWWRDEEGARVRVQAGNAPPPGGKLPAEGSGACNQPSRVAAHSPSLEHEGYSVLGLRGLAIFFWPKK